MGKLRSVFMILLSAALIAAFAFFPKILSHVLDREHLSSPDYKPINPVQLEIRQELSLVEKLAVITHTDLMLDIPETKAFMTRQQVLDTAYKALAPYVDTMLISSFSENFETRLVLCQVQSDPELQTVVWLLSAVHDPPNAPEQFTSLGLAIDDDTGKILAIDYTREAYRTELLGQDALDVFADIYFSGLGIPDYSRFLVEDMESAYWGDNGDAVRYRFADSRYGEIYLDLNVHDFGFYVELSGS